MGRWADWREGSARVKRFEDDRNVAGLIRELDGDARGWSQYTILRSYAAEALGRLGDPRAIPSLIDHAGDPEAHVRMTILHALGQLHAHDAQEVLLAGLSDPAPVVRMSAAEALGRLDDPAVLPRLWQVLDEDSDAEVRMSAVEAIAMLGDENVASRIPGVLRDVSWRVRLHPHSKRLRRMAETVEPPEPEETRH